MKILVANIGSTSLKWRLFDFSNNGERLLHKGGFERVTDYHQAIEDCLAELKNAKAIASEDELSAVGFKTVDRKKCHAAACSWMNTCWASHDRLQTASRPAHNPPTSPASNCSRNAYRTCRSSDCLKLPFTSSRPKPSQTLPAGFVVSNRRAPLGLSRREPQVHRRAVGGITLPP